MNKYINIIVLICFVSLSAAQTPLGTEFTYQGELKNSNNDPHNGQFDFRFVAFDTENDGTGNTLGMVSVEDVEVNVGLFTTQLDFGSSAFVGDKVWLEISVRDGASIGGYQQLLPRQQMTATPYATHAQFVGVDAISDMQIQDGSITSADLGNGSVSTNQLANDSVNADKIAADAVGSSEISSNAVGVDEIDSTVVQRRITSACAVNMFISSINEDGTIVCEEPNSMRKFLGLSSTTTGGAIEFNGKTGTAGAFAMCQSSYPNEPTAHFCTPNDIDLILQYDNTPQSIKNQINLIATWVNIHIFDGFNANNTINNNCHSLGYNTGHIGRGTIGTLFFDTSPGEGLPLVDRINYQFNQACSQFRQVLCCSGF